MSETPALRVAVLLGGESGEREVSLHSGLAVAGALLTLGYRVRLLDPATAFDRPFTAKDDPVALATEAGERPRARGNLLDSLFRLRENEVDLVANILHGGAGEGGEVASILEMSGLAYFGSAPAAG